MAGPAGETPAQRICRLRVEMGLSQSQLARRVGVVQPTITHWESGRVLPNRWLRVTLADVLGVDAEWLYSTDDDGNGAA